MKARRILALGSLALAIIGVALWPGPHGCGRMAYAIAEFPDTLYLSNAARTNAEMKAGIEDWLQACRQLPGAWECSSLTISGGAVTAVSTYCCIWGETWPDDLENLGMSMPEGSIIVLRNGQAASGDIVLKHLGGAGDGRMYLERRHDFTLDSYEKHMVLIRDKNYWRELSRAWGIDSTGFRDHWRLLGEYADTAKALRVRAIAGVNDGTGLCIYSKYGDALPEVTLADDANGHFVVGVRPFYEMGAGGTCLGPYLAMDGNEIQCKAAGTAQKFYLNPHGGNVYVGNTADTLFVNANMVYHAGNWPSKASKDALTDLSYVKIQDRKASGSNGGTFTEGDWRARVLGTEITDTGALCSILTGDTLFALDAGIYRCVIECPAYDVGEHMARLYNIDDAAVEIEGTTETTGSAAQSWSRVRGRFTLSAKDTLKIQHKAKNTKAASGLGNAGSLGSYERYTTAEFWRLQEI